LLRFWWHLILNITGSSTHVLDFALAGAALLALHAAAAGDWWPWRR